MTYRKPFKVPGFEFKSSEKRTTGKPPLMGRVMVCLLAAALIPASIAFSAGRPDVQAPSATAEFQAGKFRQAAETLENALKNGALTQESQLLLARSYYELGSWGQAAAAAESAVRMNPSNPEAHLWLGRAYGRKAEQERSLTLALKTRRQFEKAVELAPGNVDARRDLMQFYLDAPWIVGGSKEKARKQAQALAGIDPVEGALARARLDENAGKQAEAGQEYSRVLEMKPGNVGPYLEAADFYIAHKDVTHLDAAIAGAEKVNRTDERLNYYRGVARVLGGQRLALAARDLKSYAAHAPRHDNPSKASALSWLGEIYERWGEAHLAMLEYQAALQLDPGMLRAKEGLSRLKSN
ncbi:MAG: tetratricopeptide repeat protein [Acidobacteriota bacterium]|nr:tetratricopeptide repeat protein [Acidobacteriota bacterium]